MPAILLKRQALSRTKIFHSGFWVYLLAGKLDLNLPA